MNLEINFKKSVLNPIRCLSVTSQLIHTTESFDNGYLKTVNQPTINEIVAENTEKTEVKVDRAVIIKKGVSKMQVGGGKAALRPPIIYSPLKTKENDSLFSYNSFTESVKLSGRRCVFMKMIHQEVLKAKTI